MSNFKASKLFENPPKLDFPESGSVEFIYKEYVYSIEASTISLKYEENKDLYNYIFKYEALLEEIFANKTDAAARATKLHEAEAMLLGDMPIIPIIFNQNAYLISGELSGQASNYFGFRNFCKLKLKDYVQYLDIETTAEEEAE
jgi:hypothetical protein